MEGNGHSGGGCGARNVLDRSPISYHTISDNYRNKRVKIEKGPKALKYGLKWYHSIFRVA